MTFVINPTSFNSFFQSIEFGEFQKKIPYRGAYWELKDGLSRCIVIKNRIRLGYSWLWIPYGPIGFSEKIFEEVEEIATKESAIFTRVEPGIHWPDNGFKILNKTYQLIKVEHRYAPECTLILDLKKDKERLLAEMKPKARYNIHVAQKNNVQIINVGNNPTQKQLDDLYILFQQTGGRDNFGIHPEMFYEKIIKEFPCSTLYLAYHEKKITAGIIVIYYKNSATYYYGASDYNKRSLMSPYLLQWQAINDAQKNGKEYWDFLGISPTNKPDHSLTGVTQFKLKFGGEQFCFPQAFDVIHKKTLYALLRLKRGL